MEKLQVVSYIYRLKYMVLTADHVQKMPSAVLLCPELTKHGHDKLYDDPQSFRQQIPAVQAGTNQCVHNIQVVFLQSVLQQLV